MKWALATVVAIWLELREAIRAGILAMVRTAFGKGNQHSK